MRTALLNVSAMNTLPVDASHVTPCGTLKRATPSATPSAKPARGPPATVPAAPLDSTRTIEWLLRSAMYATPAASTEMEEG